MDIKSDHTYEYIETNGVTLHVLVAGDKSNELVILLHGFPEFHKGWEKQVDTLVDAGYYVIVPDQRGYNKSDKPLMVGSYRIDKLAMDIVGLIDTMDKDRAYIAGHDWGAAVAWYMGMHYADRIHRLLIVNVPHSSVLRKTIKENRAQRKKSSYILFFQLPLLPQFILRKNNFRNLMGSILRSANKGTFSKEDIAEYKQAWSNKRAVPAMLNWYRAIVRRRAPITNLKVECPTLIIWGENDKFLSKEMAESSLEYCEDGKLEFISDATHWVLHEKPEIVNPKIVEFFSQNEK